MYSINYLNSKFCNLAYKSCKMKVFKKLRDFYLFQGIIFNWADLFEFIWLL